MPYLAQGGQWDIKGSCHKDVSAIFYLLLEVLLFTIDGHVCEKIQVAKALVTITIIWVEIS